MRVRGNMASTQSSVDFYLKLSSLGNIKTIEGLRDHYFNIFLNEERSQANLLLKEKRKLEERKASELKEASKLENGNLNLDNRIEDTVDDIFSSSFFSEEGESKDASYDDSDIFSSNFFSEEDSDSGKQYVSHGIYLEDVDLSTDGKEGEVSDVAPSSIEVNENVITPSQGYVEHGVFLDDVVTERVDEEDNTFEGFEEVEDTSESIIEDVEDESFEGFEDAEEVFEDTEDDVFEGFEEEEDTVFEDIEEEESIEEVDEDDNTFEGFEEEGDNVFEDIEEEELFEDTEENEEVFEESEDVTEFNEVESTDIVEEPEDSLPSLEVSKVEEPLEIPNDIRVFLRQHPNSDISYVSQFYPMKEINRQVKLGRIYKKKGKLLI